MTTVGFSAYEPTEVNVFGSLFETVDLPRSKQKKVAALFAKLATGELGDGPEDESAEDRSARLTDAELEVYFAILDERLKAKGDSKQKPSTLLRKAWKGEDMTYRGFHRFLEDLAAAEGTEEDRPT